MKKRPLFWTGVWFTLIVACMLWAAGGAFLPRGRTASEQYIEDGTELLLYGQVADCSLQPEGMRLFLDHIRINSDVSEISTDTSFHSKEQILCYTDRADFLPGDLVQVQGEVSAFSPASNPGQFDAQAYYGARNVQFSLKKSKILEHAAPDRGSARIVWKRALYRLKHSLCRSCQAVFEEEHAAALSAIMLGEKLMLEQEQKTLYQEGGISHVLAISGLHISMVGMGLYRLLRKCRLPIAVSAALSGCVLVSYIEMVGWSPSSARACVMFFLWLGARLVGRAYDRLTALAAAAICVLGRQPGWLLEAAFQLSFLAILSLATLAEALPGWLEIRGRIKKACLGGAALQLGMLPCTLYFFYQIPPWSILVNLAVVPLMSFVMGFGLLGGFLGMAAKPAGVFLAAPCHYLLEAISGLCRLEQRLPWNLAVCGRPGVLRILLYYAVLGAAAAVTWLVRSNKRMNRTSACKTRSARMLRMLWAAVSLACWLLMQPAPVSGLEVLCLDVGQGDGLLLRMPSGTVCMIDGGSSSVNGVWNYRIGQTAKYLGIRKIDWWFVSHSDLDHVSGLMEFLQDYRRNAAGQSDGGITLCRLVLPAAASEDERQGELRRLAKKNGIAVYTMEAGDFIGISDDQDGGLSRGGEKAETAAPEKAWSLQCLAPESTKLTGDKNQDSLVLLLRYQAFSMLFTGDLEKEGEQRLLETVRSLDVDVLKVGHHGSANASSDAFLAAVMPEAAVISCARKNSYGHPSPAVLKRLAQAGCRTYITSREGAIQIRSDGTVCRISSYCKIK